VAFVRAAALADLGEASLLGVEIEGHRVCLARLQGNEVYAFADNCTHRDFPLSAGELDVEECYVTCDWHGAQFDLKTGRAMCLPATRPVQTFPVQVQGDDILVDVAG
jgi:3-phenylpropionate/trans-cinnamate dioxygenase ferredoxin component